MHTPLTATLSFNGAHRIAPAQYTHENIKRQKKTHIERLKQGNIVYMSHGRDTAQSSASVQLCSIERLISIRE